MELRNVSAFILHLPIFLEGSLSKNRIYVYLYLSFAIISGAIVPLQGASIKALLANFDVTSARRSD
jgi:hypothetical protein